MKKTLSLLFAILCLSACLEKELSPEFQQDNNVLYASMEAIDATRTSMDEYNNVLWSENDQLVAFMKTTLGIRYQIKEQYVGTTTGGFSKVQDSGSGDDLESGQEIDHNVVLYPYSDQVWCMKYDNSTPAKSYKLNVVLPETQTYAENSFANGAFPMVAVSSTNQLTFKNICGGLKLQFRGVDKIKSIRLEGLAGEAISGKAAVVAFADGSAPTITMAATASTSVTLDCGDGIQLNETTPTTFIIAVPPVTFASGMKITVTDTYGLSKTLTNTSSNTIKRSSLLNFPVITYEQEPIFELPEGTATSFKVESDGGSIDIPLITNHGYNVVIPEKASKWVNADSESSQLEKTIHLNIGSNIGESRSAIIRIESTENPYSYFDIKITQDAYYFNSNHCIYYKENKRIVREEDGDYYVYRSSIKCNETSLISGLEMKFKLSELIYSQSGFLACGNNYDLDSCDDIQVSKSGISIWISANTNYFWGWSEIGISPTDLIILKFSGADQTITINNKVLSCPGISSLALDYLFSGYARESDEGELDVRYYGIPEESELYYVKMYDAQGDMIYIGHPKYDTERNEHCWYSSTYNGIIKYQYASDSLNMGGYGGNF